MAAVLRVSLAEALAARPLDPEPSRVELPAYNEVDYNVPRKIELRVEAMPKKVQLPTGATMWNLCEALPQDLSPAALGRSPHSPPPALPPALPPSLCSPEPPTPPPALCPGNAALAPPSPVQLLALQPASLPPAAPPSLPAALAEESPELDPPLLPPSLPMERADSSSASQRDRGSPSRLPLLLLLQHATKAPSPGSASHGTGYCRPCAWFWKPGGCQNGLQCAHCHLCPEGEIKARKKARQTLARLGLATPVARAGTEVEASRALGLVPGPASAAGSPVVLIGSELESTTGASSEQEWSGCSGSEQESAGDSDREETTQSSAQLKRIAFSSENIQLPPGLAVGHDSSRLGFQLPPGLGLPPTIPNFGSVLHTAGRCQPCAWFWKPASCANGRDCGFCHICPQGTIKARKKTRRATRA